MGASYRLFGLTIASPAPLPAPIVSNPPDLEIIDRGVAPAAIAKADQLSYTVKPDGTAIATWLDRIQFSVPADGRSIEFTYANREDAQLIFDYLLAQAVSVALVQRQVEPLHATAVEIDGRLIALLGDCGAGKSTLAAALIKRGGRLLTDDLLVISAGTALAQPGAQRIKLTRETAGVTIGDRPAARLADERAKWSYPLQANEYCAEPRPLRQFFIMRSGREAVSREELAPAESLRELLAATFNPLDQRPERLQRHMQFTAELSGSVPAAALRVPWDLDRLDRTAATICELIP